MDKSQREQQEIIFKLSMFEQQIQQLQQQLQAVEESVIDLNTLNFGLDELKGSKDKEIMAPLGRGIFVKTKLLSEDLTVDVGRRNFVKKTIPETKEIIEEQIKKLGKVKKELDERIEEINLELTKTIIEAQKKGDSS
jgi:prefoldin alpha subunit